MVDFGAGEPDFPTPQNVKQAAIDAINQNFTNYTNTAGTEELKQAICDSHKKNYGTAYNTKECIVTVGGKHAIFGLTQALLEEGDECVIPVPYWVTYKDVVNFAGGKCVFVESDEQQGFTVTASLIAQPLPARTRMQAGRTPMDCGLEVEAIGYVPKR